MTKFLLALGLTTTFAASASAAPPIKGVALGMYQGIETEAEDLERLREISFTGADTVSLVVSWQQHDVKSEVIAISGATLSDDHVRHVIEGAHKLHLKVFLFPIVDVEVRHPLEWRGTISPPDVDTWWKSYEDFIGHYAQLAADEHVELLAIGSELVSTETWRDRWFHLISAVQKKYKGKLLYSANWDHYEQVSFWDRVDYVGVTAYNELTRNPNAGEDELTKAWNDVRVKLVTFAAKVKRPLVITEIGYTSQEGAAVHPWDYTQKNKIDLEEQRKCYQAFVNAWKDEKQLAGVFWWNWFGQGGVKDNSYTPKGKPAETVLRTWYGAADVNALTPAGRVTGTK